jgi:hypothetical protein
VTEVFTRADDSNSPQPPYNDLAVQHPHIDTNGDGIGSNEVLPPTGSDPTPDGFLDFDGNGEADPLYLGVGPSYNTNSPDNPADIIAVTPTRFLEDGQNTATLQLSANYDSEVFAAWVEIRAPATVLAGQGGSIQLNPELQKELLLSPAECQSSLGIDAWCTSYADFTTPGMYEIFYFVQDKVPGESVGGAVSPAWRSVVYKNSSSNTPPAAFDLLAPANGASPRTELAFDWDSSSDPDGLSYTLEIATDTQFGEIVHRQEGLAVSHTVVDESAGLVDGDTYYWRVIAVDGFGAQTVSTTPYRSFTTNNGNARRGFIYTTVRDAVSGVALNGATVSLLESTTLLDIYEDNGEYTLVIEPVGEYTVQVDLTDYDSNSVSGVDAALSPSITVNLSADAGADADGDGIVNTSDNCPGTANASQTDTDGDGDGNACDSDDDNDGVNDGSDSDDLNPDICLDSDADSCDDCAVGSDNFGPLPDNLAGDDGPDLDTDGLCDAGDPDIDGDGISNELDDFPTDPGESVDTDGDGIGNNSDTDDDGDDLSDALETGFFLTNPLLVDSDGDGLVDGYDGIVLLAVLPGGVDFNGDGYVDGELGLATDPTDPDSDDDTFTDGVEIAADTDPNDPNDLPVTADGNVAPRGNIDNDVNTADYLVMMRFVLGLETPDGVETARGDLDGSGEIDLPDLILLMQIIQATP